MATDLPDAFLDAVIDTICPGLDAKLPSATRAGLSGAAYRNAHANILSAIAVAAGGAQAFILADAAARQRCLEQVEKVELGPFRALVQTVIADYYEAPAVLAAMGWRAEPPQPRGHALDPADKATAAMIERVRARGAIWRPAD